MATVESDRFKIGKGNKLIEDGRIVYAQIGRDMFELKRVKTLTGSVDMMEVLAEHTVYLLCDADGQE